MPGFGLGFARAGVAPGGAGPQFDFSAGGLPSGATLFRASPACCVEADGRITTRPPDEPRFEHDPATGRRLGLLVEPATTNRVTRSSDFSDPSWSTFRTVVKKGLVAGAAPDGGDAMRIAFGTQGGVDLAETAALYQAISLSETGAPWTASFWIRAVAAPTRVRIGLYPGVLPVASSAELPVTADRWTRLWVAAVIGGSSVNLSVRNDIAGTSADVLVWGAQFEVGTVPTSTIVSGAGPATRAADGLSLDWRRWDVRDGPATLRLFFADGSVEDVAATIAGGICAVPPRGRPLVAVRLA